MKQNSQPLNNPYKYSNTNKRYYTYDYYLKNEFGGKCVKIPLDGGFTCPNIDGKCGVGGCIYCSPRGSGDFAASSALSIREQFKETKEKMTGKWPVERYIPYFQAHTNTYAPVEVLRTKYREALKLPHVVGMNIATRADCLGEDVVSLLSEISKETKLTVELGLQTSNDETADRINRGHSFSDFCRGFNKLREIPTISVCIHIILGLPGETEEEMLQTAKDVAKLHPDQVKIHLLHVLKGTALETMYQNGSYVPLSQEEYVRMAAGVLELLPEDTVIARITGDGMADQLVAPLWSLKKTCVINGIDKYLFENNTWQGRLAIE